MARLKKQHVANALAEEFQAKDPAPEDANSMILILELRNGGLRRLTIPKTWRITFGPTIPGLRRDEARINNDPRVCLRLYDGENQKAVFTDVIAFRESTIKVEERVTKVKRMNKVNEGRRGNKVIHVEGRVTEWVDPDSTSEEDEDDLGDFLAIEEK